MTIRDLVIKRLETNPLASSIEWLTYPHGTVHRETASWQDIAGQACRLAQVLRTSSRGPGERAVIMLPTSRAYWLSFIACTLGGVIAVPLFAPTPAKSDRSRVDAILHSCKPRFILTNQTSLAEAGTYVGHDTLILDAEALMGEPSDDTDIQRCLASAGERPDDILYLQYTSGSTSRPSGAMITHSAFEFNVRQSCAGLDITPDNRVVSWLPIHHDMGLIFALGLGVMVGLPTTCMPPESFLRRPSRWIRELDCPEPAITGSPNFAYEYVLQRGVGKDYDDLDLSRIHWLLNGSEPVRPSTIQKFEEALAPYGLPAGSVRPSFGMAEATVFVSCTSRLKVHAASRDGLSEGYLKPPRNKTDSVDLVSCGPIAEGTEYQVVNPTTLETLPQERVGELWLRGPNIAQGYWQDNDHTEQAFQSLPEDNGGPWLRTGDLVMMIDDDLHIVGRLKAMLIIDGRNQYSEDLEHTVQQVDPRIRPGRVAVVSHDTGETEVPLIIAERRSLTEEDDNKLSSLIRSALTTHHGLTSAIVALVPPGFIPLTTSGKIQRPLARDKWYACEAENPRALSAQTLQFR